ncbi:MAG: hypothetical protein ACXW5U_07250 [Thermoanaerobaculia bacterium]
MSLDLETLTKSMLDGAREAVSDRWPQLRALAEVEMRKLAQTLIDVHQLLEAGAIDEKRARLLVRIQQNTARSVLCTVRGLGVLAAEQATEAAVGAVARLVNAAVKFKLLGEVKAGFKAGKDL